MKQLMLLICVGLLHSTFVLSQIKDGIYPREANQERLPVPYTYLREADVMWSRTVWRKLDLREKINLPLYFPVERISDRKSIIQVLIDAVKEGSLTAYSPVSDNFERYLSAEEIATILVRIDTIMVEDPDNEGTFLTKVMRNELDLAAITEIRIKEEWFFDRQRSMLDVRIVGIMPIKKEIVDEEVRTKPLFWIYFPEARSVFANASVFNRHNDGARLTLDDIFTKRMFSSYIYKESIVYDRSIADYMQGQDALLEAENIKKNMFNMESDYWEY